jgi:hypothetical protein
MTNRSLSGRSRFVRRRRCRAGNSAPDVSLGVSGPDLSMAVSTTSASVAPSRAAARRIASQSRAGQVEPDRSFASVPFARNRRQPDADRRWHHDRHNGRSDCVWFSGEFATSRGDPRRSRLGGTPPHEYSFSPTANAPRSPPSAEAKPSGSWTPTPSEARHTIAAPLVAIVGTDEAMGHDR